jgi:excisionase family DNA binding protein
VAVAQDTPQETPQGLPEETLLTFKEAMSFLRVSRQTIYRLMETRQLVGYKVGSTWRFYLADVKACVQAAPLYQASERRERWI